MATTASTAGAGNRQIAGSHAAEPAAALGEDALVRVSAQVRAGSHRLFKRVGRPAAGGARCGGSGAQSFGSAICLALEAGQVIETQWADGDDMPLAASQVQLAWSEFEVIDNASWRFGLRAWPEAAKLGIADDREKDDRAKETRKMNSSSPGKRNRPKLPVTGVLALWLLERLRRFVAATASTGASGTDQPRSSAIPGAGRGGWRQTSGGHLAGWRAGFLCAGWHQHCRRRTTAIEPTQRGGSHGSGLDRGARQRPQPPRRCCPI